VWAGPDAGCNTVSIAPGFYEESVEVQGSMALEASSGEATLSGRLVVRGAGVQLTTQGITVLTSCTGAVVEVKQGAGFSSDDFDADLSGIADCPPLLLDPSTAIFGDDFESGDASAWSASVP